MSTNTGHGMLRGLFLTDADQVRRLMRGLSQNLLSPITDPLQPNLPNMFAAERAIATRILRTIRAHPELTLLLQATMQFISDIDGDDECVLLAARDLEHLAEEKVLMDPSAHQKAYREAQVAFNKRLSHGILPHSTARLRRDAPGAYLAFDQSQPDLFNPTRPKMRFHCERCCARSISCSQDQPACLECRNAFGGGKCYYPIKDEEEVVKVQIIEEVVKGGIMDAKRMVVREPTGPLKRSGEKPNTIVVAATGRGTQAGQLEASQNDGKPKQQACGTDKKLRPLSDFRTNPKTGVLYKTCIDCQAKMVEWTANQKRLKQSAQEAAKRTKENADPDETDDARSPDPAEKKRGWKRKRESDEDDYTSEEDTPVR